MKELGRVLRNKREQLGISLDELQAKTKIRKRYLIALEDGDWELLPGDVYARGFVRSYAEAVGLDGAELLEKYIGDHVEADTEGRPGEGESPVGGELEKPSVFPEKVPQELTESVRQPRRKNTSMSRSVVNPRRKRGRNVTGEAVAVVAILAVVGAAWWFIGGSGQGEHPKDNNLSMSPQSNAVNKPSNTTAAGQGNAVNHGVGNQAMSNAGGAGRGAPTALKVVSQSFTNNEQTYVVATSAPLNVQLQATGSCWLQTTADGKMVDSGETVSANGQRSWTANQSIRIRLGLPSSVTISVNGQSLQLPNTNNPIWVTVTKGQAQ
ncbi:helix-turn-helix domain-containing protein [Alicyclobacillus pomorum]|uniref:helix-turn-helix domain-containing protein n=1 Tax=Alicyclobacillus pomorum TaxID=204470 RepID=UPI0003F92784|nr:RodZ domain-containing protein [Alicyclobacillus pomorum]